VCCRDVPVRLQRVAGVVGVVVTVRGRGWCRISSSGSFTPSRSSSSTPGETNQEVLAAVVICDLLIRAFQYVHHFIVAQVVPELWGDLYDILILVVFKIIFD
jgi:hypothetical protein